MRLTGVIWLRDVVEKLLLKHAVTTDEVEEVFKECLAFFPGSAVGKKG